MIQFGDALMCGLQVLIYAFMTFTFGSLLVVVFGAFRMEIQA
jgi:hypothetical protein